jgi:sodium transport system permease protein
VKINLPILRALFGAEIRMLLRDRRTIVASVVLPLLVMPLVLFSASWVHRHRAERLDETVYRYAVRGSEVDRAREVARSALEREADDEVEGRRGRGHFEEISSEGALEALEAGELHFVVEGTTVEELRSEGGERAGRVGRGNSLADEVDGEKGLPPELLVLRILFRADRDESTGGMQRMSELLREARRAGREGLLRARGFPLAPGEVGVIEEVNVASEGQVAGLHLGRVLTLFLLLFLLPSAAVVATDSLAGEKERGTLETLLTTAAGRIEIIVAKHLSILAVTVAITIIQGLNLLVYVGFELIPLPVGLTAAVTPGVALILVVLYLPVAGLVAGVLLVTSGYAKSYKEAQLYFMPVFLVGLVPALAPLLSGLSLQSVFLIVPVANVALAAREILTGVANWPLTVVSWLITAAAAVGTAWLGVRGLSRERLITVMDRDVAEVVGGLALFERRVWRWFAVMWAVLLIVSGNYSESTDLRVQVLVNVVGLFLGGSLLMLWRYRLNPRTTLALRAPQSMVWLAVTLGVPGGLLTGVGVFRLADRVIPVPPELIETFGQSLLPEGIPFWQILFFLAVLPGVIEELAFRGVLLHGLHRRMHPVWLVLVVGLVFGFFHVALFRIVPTAFLGVLFAVITVLTGSIFPAMLWHVLHNASSVLLGYWQVPLDGLPVWVHALGAGVLAGSLWIIWRYRTPYPGIREWRLVGIGTAK